MSDANNPRFQDQMKRLDSGWQQGEHILITGPTGSGKTTLARHIDEIRVRHGGHVVVFVGKLLPDPTIIKEYKGWTRWTTWKGRPHANERKILLWPDLRKYRTLGEKVFHQKEVFARALDSISSVGSWTVHIDEGLYMNSPSFLGFQSDIGLMHYIGRSGKVSIVMLAQRPAHLPVIIYTSASHAFVGRTRELADQKRLSELGGNLSAKETMIKVSNLERHEFLWLPVVKDWPPEVVDTHK